MNHLKSTLEAFQSSSTTNQVLVGTSIAIGSIATISFLTGRKKKQSVSYVGNRMTTYDIYMTSKPVTTSDEDFVKVSLNQARTEMEDIMAKLTETIKEKYSLDVAASSSNTSVISGPLGVAYMFLHLHDKYNGDPQKKAELLNLAKQYLETCAKVITQSGEEREGFLSLYRGRPAYHAVASIIYDRLKQPSDRDSHVQQFLSYSDKSHTYDLFNGASGYLVGCALINKQLGDKVPAETIRNLTTIIIQQGSRMAKEANSKCPLLYTKPFTEKIFYSNFTGQLGTNWLGRTISRLFSKVLSMLVKNVELTGLAHGLAGNLYALLLFPEALTDDQKKLVKDSIDYLVANAKLTDGGYKSALRDGRFTPRGEFVQWCQGATGMVFLLVRAYQVYGDETYLKEAMEASKVVWQKGLLKKGNSLCHGVAGNAYSFLSIYRASGQVRYLYSAIQFARFSYSPLAKREQNVGKNVHSLYEGLAGALCFYADMMNDPKETRFPLFEF